MRPSHPHSRRARGDPELQKRRHLAISALLAFQQDRRFVATQFRMHHVMLPPSRNVTRFAKQKCHHDAQREQSQSGRRVENACHNQFIIGAQDMAVVRAQGIHDLWVDLAGFAGAEVGDRPLAVHPRSAMYCRRRVSLGPDGRLATNGPQVRFPDEHGVVRKENTDEQCEFHWAGRSQGHDCRGYR